MNRVLRARHHLLFFWDIVGFHPQNRQQQVTVPINVARAKVIAHRQGIHSIERPRDKPRAAQRIKTRLYIFSTTNDPQPPILDRLFSLLEKNKRNI